MESKPHRCPICAGTGNVPGGFYNSTNLTEDGQVLITTGGTGSETCKSCQGLGIIVLIATPDIKHPTYNQ